MNNTKSRYFHFVLFVLGGILFLWSCAPKPVVVTQPPTEAVYPGHQTVLEADRLFESRNFDQALNYYEQYLELFPDGLAVPRVLLRIGSIQNIFGNYLKAHEAFNRVLAEYQQTPYATDAKMGVLETYYYEGKYDQAIQLASVILEEPLSNAQRARIYEVMGDTYLAIQSPEDAVNFYTMARRSAAETQSEWIVEKLKTAINLLNTTDIVGLLAHVQDDLTRSYLMYQLGVNLVEENRYDDAVRAFTDFIATYPTHENGPQARLMIDELTGKTVYNRTAIGCLLPLSGRYQTYGELALKGVEIALAKFNRQNGFSDIKLIVKDTGSESETVAAAVEALIEAKVAAIIGPLVNAEFAAQIAQNNGIPIITFTQKEKITDIGDRVFRNFLTPGMQAKRLASYAIDVLGARNFVILYPEEKYGDAFMNIFWDEVINHGGRVVGVEAYNPTHTDFAGPIKKLIGLHYDTPGDLVEIVRQPKEEDAEINGPQEKKWRDRGQREEEGPEPIIDFDAIFIPDAPTKAGLIVPQLAYYDIENVYLLGTNLWHSAKLIEMARDYVQGAIMPDGFFADSRNGRVREFVALFEDTYGTTPGVIEATTFDTAMMLFQIVSRPDIISRTAIREELIGLRDYPGVTGLTSFDSNREAQKELSLLRIEGNGFIELE
jgi:ABC-type branched-subunit amino acid transport system substrate-binding protein